MICIPVEPIAYMLFGGFIVGLIWFFWATRGDDGAY